MKVNQLKAGAALSYISMVLGYLVSIIYTPVMLRLLGQSEYGLYNLAGSVVAYLGILNFGFGSAYVRYYSKYSVRYDNKNIAKLNGMFLIIFSVLGIIAVLAGMILAQNSENIFGSELTSQEVQKAKNLIIIMVINLAISFPNIVFNSYVIANEKFVFQKLLQMIKTIANPFIVLPLLLLGYGSVGMVIVTTVLNLSIEVANVIFCKNSLHMKFSFKEFEFSLMKEMTIFSSYIFINLIVDQINWNVAKFILGRYKGTVAVAIFGLAAQLNTYYISLSTAISGVFIPRVHKMISLQDSNKKLTQLFIKVGRVQFIILSFIATGVLFFGKSFIYLWAGKDYSDSYIILLLLIIPAIVPLIQNIGIEITRAKNLHQFRSWVYLFIALANVMVSIPLAKMFGGIGAATGTSLSLMLGHGFLMNWYYHKKVGIDIVLFWKQILVFAPALLIPIIFGCTAVIYANLYNIISLIVLGVIYSMTFFASMWFFGMNPFEKNLVRKPIYNTYNKIINKVISKK